MHIEPGYVAPVKVALANTAALGAVGWTLWQMVKDVPSLIGNGVKTLLAALFFSLFMQSFHMSIGPSELHFIGASVMYLLLGFWPTVLGFALGLALQGLLFEPLDLVHLGVNSLSLIVPLVAVHKTIGHKLFDRSFDQRVNWATILKLDAMYYAGVAAMVGFWLSIGEVQTPFSAWLAWASSYLAVVACEPFLTWGLLKGLKKLEHWPAVARFTAVGQVNLAR